MKKVIRMVVLLAVIAAALFTTAPAAPLLAGDNDPLYIDFYKTDPESDFVWDGTVSGDVNGNLQTVFLEGRMTGDIMHVVFDWIVTGSECDFSAQLSGILDTKTGQVLMNGTVTEGCYLGAQVHEEGQLVDPGVSGFAGTIRIMPGSAG
ncbi:MAG: hypothetical protein R3248_04335 [Candidatus Promineifilaceae bacterium]|nr:hypothetical protein [Candidatus Promineifilaceae bacterium]